MKALFLFGLVTSLVAGFTLNPCFFALVLVNLFYLIKKESK